MWQSPRVKTAFAVIGLLFTLAGTSLAGWALVQDYKHSQKPFWPWVVSVREWFLLRVLRRTRSVTVVGTTGRGTWSVESSGMGIALASADASIEEQFADLRKHILDLHTRITTERQEIKAEIGTVRQSVLEARSDANQALTGVEKMARDMATGTVKIQFWGIMLVGFGSVFAALPVVLGWR